MTLVVNFLESEIFCPSPLSTSPLQGEIRDEELNWLRFDWPGFNDNEIQVNEE